MSAAAFAGAAAVVCWPLAVAACVVAPVFFLTSRAFSGRIQQAAEQERSLTGKLTSAIEESLSGQALIQAHSRQLMELLGPVIAGRTVIVITHDPAVAASADRVITLNSLVPVSAARSADRYGLFR